MEMNRSLDRGIAILRAFKPGLSELGNAEIAERTGLPKATVSRLTQTLVSGGLLQRDAAQRVYRLAPAVLSFAHAMRLSSPILSVIAPLMRAEATRRHVNVGLAAADDDMMVYLESFRYSPRASFRTVVSGQRVPMELTSLGRAYLWAIPREVRESELAAIARRRPKGWRHFRHEIERSFAELAELGYCTVRWQPGVVAVATSLQFDRLEPHSLNMSLASEDSLGDVRRRLGPWLLDLKRRCLDKLDLNAAPDIY
jgi:DNA-binding IclR family transcriptional regulator